MPVLSVAETITRPASVALATWFPAPSVGRAAERRDALVSEQQQVAAAISATVARMGAELDNEVLDELTDETTTLFARAEELRLAMALASRAATDTWLAALDLD